MSESNRTYTEWQHEREVTRIETQAKHWRIAFWVVLSILIVTVATWIVTEKVCKPAASDGGYEYWWLIPEEEEPAGPVFG